MTYNDFIQDIINTRGQWSDEVRYSERGCERHHIILKCKGGLPKTINWKPHPNIIWLYPEEHFIAHKLLAQENWDDKQIVAAWTYMLPKKNGTHNFSLTPEEYAEVRKAYLRMNCGDMNPACRPDVKAKISAWAKVNNKGEGNPRYGVKLTNKDKQKISEATRRGMQDPELRRKLSEKKAAYNTGCRWFTDGVKSYFTKKCPEGCWLGRAPKRK